MPASALQTARPEKILPHKGEFAFFHAAQAHTAPWKIRSRYDEGASAFDFYAYVGNDPLNKNDPTGTYGRGIGWGKEDWRRFNQAQQRAATDMEKKAGDLQKGAADMDKIGRHDMADRLRTRAENLRAGAADLRSDAKPADLLSAKTLMAMGAAGPNSVAGAYKDGSGIGINKDHPAFQAFANGDSFAEGRFRWYIGHESLHTGAGLRDEIWAGNGQKAYKFGSSAQQEAFFNLPQRQTDINPDHLMDDVY